jgi:hypothetical protein
MVAMWTALLHDLKPGVVISYRMRPAQGMCSR